MKVWLKSIGDLRDYFGREPIELELQDDGTLQDLLVLIDKRWGSVLPQYLWKAEEKRFRGAVFFLINKEVVQDTNFTLRDGLEVQLMRALSGG